MGQVQTKQAEVIIFQPLIWRPFLRCWSTVIFTWLQQKWMQIPIPTVLGYLNITGKIQTERQCLAGLIPCRKNEKMLQKKSWLV